MKFSFIKNVLAKYKKSKSWKIWASDLWKGEPDANVRLLRAFVGSIPKGDKNRELSSEDLCSFGATKIRTR